MRDENKLCKYCANYVKMDDSVGKCSYFNNIVSEFNACTHWTYPGGLKNKWRDIDLEKFMERILFPILIGSFSILIWTVIIFMWMGKIT